MFSLQTKPLYGKIGYQKNRYLQNCEDDWDGKGPPNNCVTLKYLKNLHLTSNNAVQHAVK